MTRCSKRQRDEHRLKRGRCVARDLKVLMLVVVMLVGGGLLRPTPYDRRYVPFMVTDASQIYRPSVPFPGIFDISFPKANFQIRVRKKPSDVSNKPDQKSLKESEKKEDAEIGEETVPVEEEYAIKPTIKPIFGKKRYVHYNDHLFVENNGLDFDKIMTKASFEKIGTEVIENILHARKNTQRKPNLRPAVIPPYYKNLIAQYDPKIQFFDAYTEQQFYIDMLNFINKAEDRLEFFKTKHLSAHSPYLHDVGKLIIEKTNDYRISKKLRPSIRWSEPFYFTMLNHSIHMSNIGKLTHDGFDKRTEAARRIYDIESTGENLAFFNPMTPFSKTQIADMFMKLWINSEPHRLNLEGDFNLGSVSIFKNFDGDYWAIMFLAKI